MMTLPGVFAFYKAAEEHWVRGSRQASLSPSTRHSHERLLRVNSPPDAGAMEQPILCPFTDRRDSNPKATWLGSRAQAGRQAGLEGGRQVHLREPGPSQPWLP